MAAEQKTPSAYAYLADLKAQRRERDILLAVHVDALPEEIRAHQLLIMQREAELAAMPMPPGILTCSSNLCTWIWLDGRWAKQVKLTEQAGYAPANTIVVGNKVMHIRDPGGDNDSDDELIDPGNMYVYVATGVCVGVGFDSSIYRGAIGADYKIQWGEPVVVGKDEDPVVCVDDHAIYVYGDTEIVVYELESNTVRRSYLRSC